MNTVIVDGTGSGKAMQVNDKNQLVASAEAITRKEQRSRDGFTFNLNTGLITLTSATESAVAYIKHTDTTTRMIVDSVGYDIYVGANNAGTPIDDDAAIARIYKNILNGTLVTNAVVGDVAQNKNFNSGNDFAHVFYKGAEGNTITEGALTYISPMPRVINTGDIVLNSGKNLAVTIQPPATTTNMVIALFFSVYFEEL